MYYGFLWFVKKLNKNYKITSVSKKIIVKK